MKRGAWILLLPLLASTGCVNFSWPEGVRPWHKSGSEPSTTAVKVERDPAEPLPILDDQVNEGNAEKMANALRDELDFAETHPPEAPAKFVSKPGSQR